MNQEKKILSIIGIVTAAIVIGAVLLLGQSGSTVNTSKTVDPKNLNLLVKDDSYKTASSSANAKVTVIEFSDFQCPACAAAEPGVQQVVQNYKEQVNIVYRHFPLPQHKNGTKAAQAAEAAGEQGKFWEMAGKLFSTQEEWGESDDPMKFFVNYVEGLGLDINKFKADASSNKYADKIKKDQTDGITLGVNSTPTFFIAKQEDANLVSAEKVPGALSFDEFKSTIDPLLK